MRLKPGLTSDQAYEVLSATATMSWGLAAAAALQKELRSIADFMQVIGNLDIPDDTEPLFLEDLAAMTGAEK
jgi:hypothetical protein